MQGYKKGAPTRALGPFAPPPVFPGEHTLGALSPPKKIPVGPFPQPERYPRGPFPTQKDTRGALSPGVFDVFSSHFLLFCNVNSKCDKKESWPE